MSDPEPGLDLARAAAALIGTRFRLHGRDPATGLDCVGVLEASLIATGRKLALPGGYGLRMRTIAHYTRRAAEFGFAAHEGEAAAGDIMLFCVGPGQYHFTICESRQSFIHAHAGLRRVVRSAVPTDWPLVGHWRLVA